MPISNETLMLFLGFSCTNQYSILISIILASLGSLSGSIIAYLIGYRYGEGVILKFGKPFKITKEKLDKTKILLEKHEAFYLIVSRFIPGLRVIIPYLCGILKLSKRKVILYNIISSIIWCTSFVLIGFFVGDKWTNVGKLIKAYTLTILIVLIFVFIVFKFFNKHKKVIFTIAIPVFVFIEFCSELMKQELKPFDLTIYKFIAKVITEDMTDLMKFISNLGSPAPLITISLICIAVFWKSKTFSFYSKMIAVNLTISTILDTIFKIVFHRQRPDILRLITETGYSFPSGHSMISLSFYGFIIYLCFKFCKNPWKYIIAISLSTLIFLIGISRIYLGVHYASDVIAGFFAGFAWLATFIVIVNKLNLSLKEKSIGRIS